MDNSARSLIDWAVAGQALTGQAESGDRAWTKVGEASAHLAVVDGLGHGSEAVRAALSAISVLDDLDGDSPIEIFKRCHERLKPMRGAVMSLASFQAADSTMTWLGVGNIEGVLLRRRHDSQIRERETLVQVPGVLGDRLPPLMPSVVKVSPGDILIFATDGVGASFAENANLRDSPQDIADRILNRYAKGTDDALVLVARYGYVQGEAKDR
jgi:phosphoserine phosphatase RsbX